MSEEHNNKREKGAEKEWERDWDKEKSAPHAEDADTFDELSEKD